MRFIARERGSGASREQLRLLVDRQADEAVALVDPDQRVRLWNEGARRLLGFDADEVVGEPVARLWAQDERDRGEPDRALEIAAREGRFACEGTWRRKDASRVRASVAIDALRDERGRLLGYGVRAREAARHRRAEPDARDTVTGLPRDAAELEQFRLLVSSVRDYAIVLLDPEGRVRTWNPGAEALKGYAAEEIVGRHFSVFYDDEDRANGRPAATLAAAARDGRVETEAWRVRKDGSRFWAGVLVTAVRDARGALIGFAKVTRDLSERRAAEERLQRIAAELARSNADLERFASAAAHDLVDPLHTISGLAELLRTRYGAVLDERGRRLVDEIGGAAVRLRELVYSMLDYARGTRRESLGGRVAVADALGAVLARLRRPIEARGARIRYDPAALPVVAGDAVLVESVLQNLVSNAIKYTNGSAPRVEVTAEPVEDGAMWRISVADEGIGIAPEDRERIFRLFDRVDPHTPGTGIGLPLAARLVERMGGAIGVDSTPGAGSRFWFTLPAAPDA
jgi:PAS domain S-box-containing protein